MSYQLSFKRRLMTHAGVLATTSLLVFLSPYAMAGEQFAGEIKPFPKPNVVFEYNAGVVMDDGLPLRVNIFRPSTSGKYPVIVTHGIYGKDVAWQEAEPYKPTWSKVTARLPDLCKESTCSFMRWEMPDPERWVPAGYVVIQADARGSGKTGGYLDPQSPREAQDYKALIEWASRQPWSNGKVGLIGISYYAIGQWNVAALQPKGLAAMIPWEGAADPYRDSGYHGGIESGTFTALWAKAQVLPNQNGNGTTTFRDAIVGGAATGEPRTPATLAGSRFSWDEVKHPFLDAYHRQRTPDLSRITIPTLSVGNWTGMGLHLRGNIEGYTQIASRDKWLRMHTGDHFTPFYEESAFSLQKAFFDRHLKGDTKAFSNESNVVVTVRDPVRGDFKREDTQWPLTGTHFEKWYLDAGTASLSRAAPAGVSKASYEALSAGKTFTIPPSEQDREFTGPLMARLWVSSTTTDADLFLTIRLFDPAGKEITFEGTVAPAVPVAQGWLRLSHRDRDEKRSLPHRPVYLHQEAQPMEPGKPYQADVEIWPTSIVVPRGYTLALTVQGKDFEFPHISNGFFKGSAPFLHLGRDPKVYGGQQTLHSGGQYDAYLLLPAVSPRP
ncbi:MAG: CocE/NonD family hydrolase [Burkholderiales bacterium]|nr:CocE/NonD family hydrolase [Burkholderiales bacterium]